MNGARKFIYIRSQKINLEIKLLQGAVEFDARIVHRLIIVAVSCFPLLSESIKKILKIKIWFFACYHSVQNLLSSSLLSKNLKIKIYRTIILPAVLCGCETWSLTLREERGLRVFDK
jgi:hypothetical protein